MKTESMINEELDKLRQMKHEMIFNWEYSSPHTIEEVEDAFVLLYDVKNIFQRNNIRDVENIIKDERKAVIQEEKKFKNNYVDKYSKYYHDKLYYLHLNLSCLNWVLDKDYFDREI